VAAPSLAVFKARLDGALSNLGWGKASLLMTGGLELDDLQGPFQPKPFYDSMTTRGGDFHHLHHLKLPMTPSGAFLWAPAKKLLTYSVEKYY